MFVLTFDRQSCESWPHHLAFLPNIVDNSLYDAVEGLVDGLYELGVLGTVWESNATIIDEYIYNPRRLWIVIGLFLCQL